MRTVSVNASSSPASSHRWLTAMAAVAALAASSAALAEIHLSVAATATNAAASDGVIFDDSVKQASGYMFAAGNSGGSIHEGPLACPGSDYCGPPASTPGATAAATVDMSVGHLGVSARAWSNPPEVYQAQGLSTIHVNDTLFATGTLTFSIRIDVGLNASDGNDTFADYDFSLTLGNDEDRRPFFSFAAWDDPNGDAGIGGRGAAYSIDRFWEGPGQTSGEVFEDVPSVFSIDIDVPIFQGTGMNLEIYNFARAQSEDGNTASVSSLNSGYVGIAGDYASAAGYNYVGYAAPVPEPGSIGLWLLGGGLLLARRRCRKHR